MTLLTTPRTGGKHTALRILISLIAVLSVALFVSACGGGGSSPAPNPFVFINFGLNLSGFDPHVGQYTEFYVVENTNDLWLAAIYDPLPAASISVSAPKSLLQGTSYHVDIWADENGNGSQDPQPTDHSWSEALPAGGTLSFAHDTNWTNF